MAKRASERKTQVLLPSPSADLAGYFSADEVWISNISLLHNALSGLDGVDFVSIVC
jgi:hypothetical protein